MERIRLPNCETLVRWVCWLKGMDSVLRHVTVKLEVVVGLRSNDEVQLRQAGRWSYRGGVDHAKGKGEEPVVED